MPDTSISIERIARDAVRVRFDCGDGQGTAMFLVDVARELGGTLDEVDRWKVLTKAKSVAKSFIQCANKELEAQKPQSREAPPTE